MSEYTHAYLNDVIQTILQLDTTQIERCVAELERIRDKGRLFILGIGGSAANASHAATDFRRMAGFEAYAPSDNTAELSANANDLGWHAVFTHWLTFSRLGANDAILVLSVGGGDVERQISVNLIAAIDYAREVGATVLAIVGRPDGYAAFNADVCLVVPSPNAAHITPISESMQEVLWHLFVWHPKLKRGTAIW